MTNQIEGYFEKGQKVVVIEDLISTGGSSLKAVDTMREAGLDVKGLIAIFTYGFQAAELNFSEAECPYVTLTNYDVLLEHVREASLASSDDLDSLNDWRKNPTKWKK